MARAALPYLQDYSHLFNSFISISTPHVGMPENSDKLLTKGSPGSAGFSILSGTSKMKSSKEINMDDQKDLRTCFLYRLSQDKQLSHFKHLVLCSNPDDKFCLVGTGRIQINVESKYL